MSASTGRCLCGTVRFEARELGRFGVCHCEQCQRWAGSALFGVHVAEAAMTITEGEDSIGTYRSSDWASRSFCSRCGAALWYRFDKGRDGAGDYEVPVGVLDRRDELNLTRELFHDEKPDCWSLDGDHERLTSAQTRALFG